MTQSEPISESRVRAQAWKWYFAAIAYPLYLFLLPYVYASIGWWFLVLVIFPGVYLLTWVGYLMHESWHKYVPNVPNEAFYNLFGWMLITDPQVYRIVHGFHHSQVNSYEDTEFHPLGEIKSRPLRALHNAVEIFLGVIFLMLAANFVVPRHPRYAKRYRWWKLPISVAAWIIFFGGLGALSRLAFGVAWSQVAVAYVISLWAGSFVLHHSQMVEHGNLFVPGSWEERNVKTRNLDPAGPVEKAFLFLTHSDSQEHVLHHTMTKVYARPFPGEIPLPENAVRITFRDYLGVLGDMLAGKDSRI